MPFPFPIDPDFRKEAIRAWLEDVDERLEDDIPGAEESWKVARNIYLTLPPGHGDENIETSLRLARVKLDKLNDS